MPIHESWKNESALGIYSPVGLPCFSTTHRFDSAVFDEDVCLGRLSSDKNSRVINSQSPQACSIGKERGQIIRVYPKMRVG